MGAILSQGMFTSGSACLPLIADRVSLFLQPLVSRDYRGDVEMSVIEKFLPMVLDMEEEGLMSPILVHEKATFVYIKHNNLYRILFEMEGDEWEGGQGGGTSVIKEPVKKTTQLSLSIPDWKGFMRQCSKVSLIGRWSLAESLSLVIVRGGGG